jgi:rhodanese-related sulfurtransferase
MIPQISPVDLRDRLQSGLPTLLLDVRNYDERDYCLIDPSEFIPLPELAGRVHELDVPEGTLVVVYCHHGVRSLSGAALLLHAGIENASSLRGGIEAWSLQVDPAVRRY